MTYEQVLKGYLCYFYTINIDSHHTHHLFFIFFFFTFLESKTTTFYYYYLGELTRIVGFLGLCWLMLHSRGRRYLLCFLFGFDGVLIFFGLGERCCRFLGEWIYFFLYLFRGCRLLGRKRLSIWSILLSIILVDLIDLWFVFDGPVIYLVEPIFLILILDNPCWVFVFFFFCFFFYFNYKI